MRGIDEEVARGEGGIGRSARVALLVLVALAAGGGAVFWWSRRTEPLAPLPVVDPGAIARAVPTPAVSFRDVTVESGITFVHQNGAEGEKLLPETMGGGMAFFDAEADGDADLLFVNGCFWPESKRTEHPTQALYTNDGRGRFSDVGAASGLAATFYGMGAACADADADGDTDVYFTAVGPNRYFANEGGGRFAERDVGLCGAPDAWSICPAFLDHDQDGDLDLYVGNYVRWSRELDLQAHYTLPGIGRAYGPPNAFEGAQPFFFRNEGDGRFVEVAADIGLYVSDPATRAPVGKTLGVRASDLDLDGDLDLMVANDTVANFFYLNQGDGSFVECAKQFGLAFDRDGRPTGAMGIDAAWFRNDDAIGIAIGNFANEMSSLYVSQGRADLWIDEAFGAGIGGPTRRFLKFGTLFLDYDLDGHVDYLQANGHLENDISQVQASQTYEQPAQLFWNAGKEAKRTFVEVSDAGDLHDAIVGRACAAADVDGDGDLDVLLTQSGGKPLLLRNEQTLGSHWLRVKLVGRGGNHEAIGARVEFPHGGGRQCQEVIPFRSYLSQVELPLTFGLGAATRVEHVKIHWPDGSTQEIPELAADRLHVIEQAP